MARSRWCGPPLTHGVALLPARCLFHAPACLTTPCRCFLRSCIACARLPRGILSHCLCPPPPHLCACWSACGYAARLLYTSSCFHRAWCCEAEERPSPALCCFCTSLVRRVAVHPPNTRGGRLTPHAFALSHQLLCALRFWWLHCIVGAGAPVVDKVTWSTVWSSFPRTLFLPFTTSFRGPEPPACEAQQQKHGDAAGRTGAWAVQFR